MYSLLKIGPLWRIGRLQSSTGQHINLVEPAETPPTSTPHPASAARPNKRSARQTAFRQLPLHRTPNRAQPPCPRRCESPPGRNNRRIPDRARSEIIQHILLRERLARLVVLHIVVGKNSRQFGQDRRSSTPGLRPRAAPESAAHPAQCFRSTSPLPWLPRSHFLHLPQMCKLTLGPARPNTEMGYFLFPWGIICSRDWPSSTSSAAARITIGFSSSCFSVRLARSSILPSKRCPTLD